MAPVACMAIGVGCVALPGLHALGMSVPFALGLFFGSRASMFSDPSAGDQDIGVRVSGTISLASLTVPLHFSLWVL